MKGDWRVSRNHFDGRDLWQVWRQTRPLEPGEPMHSGVRETRCAFETEGEARACADALNAASAIDACIEEKRTEWARKKQSELSEATHGAF